MQAALVVITIHLLWVCETGDLSDRPLCGDIHVLIFISLEQG